MKRYQKYMDGVKVSDTLHEKLKNLEEPKKKPQPWTKWGAMAAALVLVIGVGAYTVGHYDVGVDPPAIGTVEASGEDVPALDIANEEPNGLEGMPSIPPTGGGYEVVDGGLAHYYLLPLLNWSDVSNQPQMSADYALAPYSALQKDATAQDVEAFAGGRDDMVTHLLWDGLDWGGTIWFLEDGTPQAAALSADGDGLHFYLEVMKGGKVPSCVVFPDEYYETSQWQGVKITAVKNGGYAVIDGVELREKREVGFFCDGVGYKLTLYADGAERADELCARFVRYAVAGGFDLDGLSADGAVNPFNYSVGEPNYED